MKIDRRAFLQFASTSPLVFGLSELFARTQSQDPPSWWKNALDRMKLLDRPGLVFVAPVGENDRDNFGWALRDLLESGDSRAREIFCASVVVCLHPNVAARCLPEGAVPGRILVLDPVGRVVDKSELRMKELRNPEAFEQAFSKLLHGEGDAHLALSARVVRAKLTDAERRALADLSADDLARRESATAELAKRAEMLMPLLVFERRSSKDPERQARLRQIIDARFDASDEITPGPKLPFGSRFEPGLGGCGAEQEDGVSIQCGMGRLEGKGQRFLRFLEK